MSTTNKGNTVSTHTELNYDQAHTFVSENSSKGFFWDGWDIVKFTVNPNGYTQKNGMFKNGTWGFAVKLKVQDSGTWRVLTKYV